MNRPIFNYCHEEYSFEVETFTAANLARWRQFQTKMIRRRILWLTGAALLTLTIIFV